MSKYQILQQSPDFKCALDAYCSSVEYEYGLLLHRFHTAKHWICIADGHLHHALQAYQAAIMLLPHVVTLDLDLHSRCQALMSGTDGLVQDAAASAIPSGEYPKAVTFLE